jgi:hypothetical protein
MTQATMTDAFRGHLTGFDLAALEEHESTIIGVDEALGIGYLNAAWFRFSAANGGDPAISARWGLGASIWPAIPAPLQPFYRQFFSSARSLNHAPTHPMTHEYECSSADVYRRLVLAVYPLRDDHGLLLVHSLRVQRPHDPHERSAQEPDASRYAHPDGMIRQCSHCRRVQLAADLKAWHWIPEWVRSCPGNTSHSLCPVCLDYYYPAV